MEDCITTERRGLYDYLKESKEDMLSGALNDNVIEEGETKGETKEQFTKRKRDERENTLHIRKDTREICREKSRTIPHRFFWTVDKKCVFEETDRRGYIICSSGAGIKNQMQSKQG